jgi:hypothetical protein
MGPSWEIETHGFTVVPKVLAPEEVSAWISRLEPVAGAGRRAMLSESSVAALACSPRLLDLVRPFLPSEPFPVRGIFFDKSPEANWLVPWHQDLTLALQRKEDVEGFGPWSLKDGIPHVQPPVRMLEQMITVRLHLDATDEANGALRVLPGSHSRGRLAADEIQEWRSQVPEVLCRMEAGDALLMRPLLLHASGRSTTDRHRRILHLEYAAFGLPAPLKWQEANPD